MSRDDAGGFLGSYEQRGIIGQDPFISLDVEGVGELLRIGADQYALARWPRSVVGYKRKSAPCLRHVRLCPNRRHSSADDKPHAGLE